MTTPDHGGATIPGTAPAGPGTTAAPAKLRVLMVGDIMGSPGRKALRRLLLAVRKEAAADLVVANGENSAGGRGISVRTANELHDAGVDVITTGNHIWAQQDVDAALADDRLRVLRPLNFPPGLPGRGTVTVTVHGVPVTVVSLMGRVFMAPLDNPFTVIDRHLDAMRGGRDPRPIVMVDFHAEATSEKVAMGWHLAGRVSAVVGTHTHVPTADARVLPGATGFVTDLGMVGPRDSVIGSAVAPSLARFVTGRSHRLPVADGIVSFNAVVVELDRLRGTCLSIRRLDRDDTLTA